MELKELPEELHEEDENKKQIKNNFQDFPSGPVAKTLSELWIPRARVQSLARELDPTCGK